MHKEWQGHKGEVLDSKNNFEVIECKKCQFKHIVPIPTEEELVKVINNAFAHENLTSFNFARNNLGRMAELRKAMWAGVKKSKNLTKLYLYKNNLESNQTKELELLGFTKGKGDEWSRDPDEEEGLINIVKNLFGW